jgi:hypothetical protein
VTCQVPAGGRGVPFVPTDEHIRSVQCRVPQLMQLKDMDPSLALAFYVRNEADFENFCERAHALKKQLAARGLPTPFSVEQAPPDYEGAMNLAAMINDGFGDESEGDGDKSDFEDEYVVIGNPGH